MRHMQMEDHPHVRLPEQPWAAEAIARPSSDLEPANLTTAVVEATRETVVFGKT